MIRLHSESEGTLSLASDPRVEMADLGQRWTDRAACAGQWKLFDEVDDALHPKGKMTPTRRAELDAVIAQAQALCASCPVFEECHAAVVPPYFPTAESAYSIVAGRDHRTFHVAGFEPPKERIPQVRSKCPRCPRMIADRQMIRHLQLHDRGEHREHGTVAGYHSHRQHGETACAPCKAAMADKSRRRRAMIQERVRMAHATQEAPVDAQVALTP